ncbi:MAG: hypothetical protein H7Y38_12440 [Armatimonadetes bacterium]|nr:hypothetical protein [Armatimonadota bacterium]
MVSAKEDRLTVDELLTRFETDDREAVRSFLLLDAEAAQTLHEAVPHIESIFGAKVAVALEAVCGQNCVSPDNPETGEAPELYALIQDDSRDFDASFSRLARFRTQWWQSVFPRVRGRLGFDVEMV